MVRGLDVFLVSAAQDRGADVNAVGGFLKETALQWAVRQGALEATVVLVRHLLWTQYSWPPCETSSFSYSQLTLRMNTCLFRSPTEPIRMPRALRA
jgi:hypothetical protein